MGKGLPGLGASDWTICWASVSLAGRLKGQVSTRDRSCVLIVALFLSLCLCLLSFVLKRAVQFQSGQGPNAPWAALAGCTPYVHLCSWPLFPPHADEYSPPCCTALAWEGTSSSSLHCSTYIRQALPCTEQHCLTFSSLWALPVARQYGRHSRLLVGACSRSQGREPQQEPSAKIQLILP